MTEREFPAHAEARGDPAQREDHEHGKTVQEVRSCDKPERAGDRYEADERRLGGERRLALDVKNAAQEDAGQEDAYGHPQTQQSAGDELWRGPVKHQAD